MMAYSSSTGQTYSSWAELVAVESNGHLVIAVMTNTDTGQTWPYVIGPYPTKREADNARARLRTRFKRDQHRYPTTTVKMFVRPAWKDPR